MNDTTVRGMIAPKDSATWKCPQCGKVCGVEFVRYGKDKRPVFRCSECGQEVEK